MKLDRKMLSTRLCYIMSLSTPCLNTVQASLEKDKELQFTLLSLCICFLVEPAVTLLTLCRNRPCLTLRKLYPGVKTNLHAAPVSLQPFPVPGDTGRQPSASFWEVQSWWGAFGVGRRDSAVCWKYQ